MEKLLFSHLWNQQKKRKLQEMQGDLVLKDGTVASSHKPKRGSKRRRKYESKLASANAMWVDHSDVDVLKLAEETKRKYQTQTVSSTVDTMEVS